MEQPSTKSQQVRTFESQDAADRWRQGAAARNVWLGPATELMLDFAGVGAGAHVLDIAAGTGEQTLAAANRVGATGSVLATDISGVMLDMAASMAREMGLTNVETHVADAQALGVEAASFDAAICRLGLMFIPDVTRGLAEIRASLKPGSKFSGIVWSSAEKNPYLNIAVIALRRQRDASGLTTRTGVAHVLGDPETLTNTLSKAGFESVAVHPVPHTRCFSSASEARQTVLSEFPGIGSQADDLSAADRDAAWAEIDAAFCQFEGPTGIEIPGELLVGVGTK